MARPMDSLASILRQQPKQQQMRQSLHRPPRHRQDPRNRHRPTVLLLYSRQQKTTPRLISPPRIASLPHDSLPLQRSPDPSPIREPPLRPRGPNINFVEHSQRHRILQLQRQRRHEVPAGDGAELHGSDRVRTRPCAVAECAEAEAGHAREGPIWVRQEAALVPGATGPILQPEPAESELQERRRAVRADVQRLVVVWRGGLAVVNN